MTFQARAGTFSAFPSQRTELNMLEQTRSSRVSRARAGQFFVLLGLTVAGVALASRASASDGKVYPGSLCAASRWDLHRGAAPSGAFRATAADTFSCPAIGDVHANVLGVNRARVYLNQPAGSSSSCTFSVYNAAGSQTFSTTAATTGSGNQFLNMSASSSPAYARYAIRCALSAGTTLFSYDITELD
jgi:hypothetical protein